MEIRMPVSYLAKTFFALFGPTILVMLVYVTYKYVFMGGRI